MRNNHFTYAEIDLSAVAGNISAIRKLLPKQTKFMAVVKANGYGHGSVQVSKAAVSAGADYLGVASLKEAMELRDGGVTSPILILSESLPENAKAVVEADISQTVYTQALAEALSKAAGELKKKAKVHLKVDTGMGRVGVVYSRAGELLDKLKALPGIELEGVFTHFAKADDPRDDYTKNQLSRFNGFAKGVSSPGACLKHAANSAAALYHPDSYLDMVRIGLSMYGLYPRKDGAKVKLAPALSFKTRVAYLKRVPPGTFLSYGATYETKKETTIATLPVGYADGFSRALSNRGAVLIRGKKFPVAGRVCMDLTLIDIGDEKVQVGDEVVLIGSQGKENISADEIADIMGTINYEVVCGIGKRVERFYK